MLDCLSVVPSTSSSRTLNKQLLLLLFLKLKGAPQSKKKNISLFSPYFSSVAHYPFRLVPFSLLIL